jgi:hypothetical protein
MSAGKIMNTKKLSKKNIKNNLLKGVSEFGLDPKEWFLLKVKQKQSHYRLRLKVDPTLEIHGYADEINERWISLNIFDL